MCRVGDDCRRPHARTDKSRGPRNGLNCPHPIGRSTTDAASATTLLAARRFGWSAEKITDTVDLGDIDTADARRDKDLRKPRLPDLDRHPRMSFDADDITGTDGEWRVAGIAEVRGRQVRPVWTVTRLVLGAGDSVRPIAETTLDRREIGIHAPQFMIGRLITIDPTVLLRAAPQQG
ncbi:YceI family protein [Nocardia sp. NPDC051463]|uniref:YceI family protein n=1 Tax=Nocardia sp. NPDC051463 TaxID=3154845 RepID=UPI0034509D58